VTIDKKFKKKLKRKEKKAGLKRKRRRFESIERLDELLGLLDFRLQMRRYQDAISLALRILKLDPECKKAFDRAVLCAARLGNNVNTYSLLSHGWEYGLIDHKRNLLALAQMACEAGDTEFSADVLNELAKNGIKYQGRLTKSEFKLIQRLKETVSRPIGEFPAQGADDKQDSTSNNHPIDNAHDPQTPGKDNDEARRPDPNVTEEDEKPLLVQVEVDPQPLLDAVTHGPAATKETLDMTLLAYEVSFQTTYDELLCLPLLKGVEAFWYQRETARKVMKDFRGRAILADEVGLGKTIEACLVLKEYMVRGLVKTALILVPSSLVNQWKGELLEKFGLSFVSTNDDLFRHDPEAFWDEPLVLASIHTARSKRHFEAVTRRFNDIVVVDEAHHLKEHTTVNWKLVNALQKTFLLLLTATPVQNNLEELYTLVTLLKPGHLQTRKAFKSKFMARGNPTDPINRELLREMLREVMIRNTRSVARVQLPPRFANTIKVTPGLDEAAFFSKLEVFVRDEMGRAESALVKMQLRRLLETAGSSFAACTGILKTMAVAGYERSERAKGLLEEIAGLKDSAKVDRVLDIILAGREKVLVFVKYRATLHLLNSVFQRKGIRHAIFQGGMTNEQKLAAVETFRDNCRVLLTTGSGGEGHNLQFCHNIINYDLPWNPMEIEQRIGRIHRIGQKQQVHIYNFCSEGSIEDRILYVLDRKINMFELVIGEIDMILGRRRGEKEFADMVFDLWVQNINEASLDKAFEEMGTRLKRAKAAYDKTKTLDEKLFTDDFGM